MIRFKKIPDNIESLLPKAIDYLNSVSDIIFAYIFGSLAKGKPVPLSDVDIAIYLKKNSDVPSMKMEILGKLNDHLHTDEIDLVILNTASLPLRMRIIENKKILVDKMPFFRHKYESLTMREYFDFSILESGILRRRFYSG